MDIVLKRLAKESVVIALSISILALKYIHCTVHMLKTEDSRADDYHVTLATIETVSLSQRETCIYGYNIRE